MLVIAFSCSPLPIVTAHVPMTLKFAWQVLFS